MIYFVTNQKSIGEYTGIELASVEEVFSYFSDQTIIQFDSETLEDGTYPGKLALIQFGTREKQFVIDCLTVDPIAFKPLLEDKSKVFLMHNAKYDLRFLFKHGIYMFENVRDTFLAEKQLSTGLFGHRASLQACVQRYLNIHISKEERGLLHRLGIYHSRIIKYAATDVMYMEDVDALQQKKLKELDMLNANKLDNLFVVFLAYAEYCGVKIDMQKWTEKATADEQELLSVEKELNAAVEALGKAKYLRQPDLFNSGYSANVNWRSPKQVIQLMKDLGCSLITVDKHTKETKESVSSDVLVSQRNVHPIVDLYLKYRDQETFVSRYGRAFLRHVHSYDKRIHTNYTQIKDTGRLASGKDKEGEELPGEVNLQNIPRLPDKRNRISGKLYERDLFIPEEGCSYVVADFSSQEARILADASNDLKYLDYVVHKDIHSFCTRLLDPSLSDLSDAEIKKQHASTRTRAKSITFAIQFGGNGATIAANLGIPMAEGERIYREFINHFPGLKKYFSSVQEISIKQGYILVNPITGRRRFFQDVEQLNALRQRIHSTVGIIKDSDVGATFNSISKEFWTWYSDHKKRNTEEYEEIRLLIVKYFRIISIMGKAALNTPIQGTAAEMFKLACIRIYKKILENNHWGIVKPPLLIHDELVLETPDDLAKEYSEILLSCMVSAGAFFCKNVEITADVHIGKTWEH